MPDPMIGGAPEEPAASSPASQHPLTDGDETHHPVPRSDENRAGAGGRESVSASVTGQVKQRLTGALDAQKGAAADKVEEFAQTVQRSAEQFQGRQDWIASAIGRGAEELNTLAGSLRRADVGDLLGQVHSFAKQRPGLFAGAAFAAGFAVARVGKLAARDMSADDLPTMPEATHAQR